MANAANAIAALLLKTIGAGQRALNRAGVDATIKVLEYSPLVDRTHLLVQGPATIIQKFVSETRSTDLDRSIVLPEFPETILDSYLNLHGQSLEDFSLIIETNFVGDLLRLAQEAVTHDLKVVELRQFRTSSSAGHLILTGSHSVLKSDWIKDQKREGEKVTLLENLSPGYRDFWAIQPPKT